jgi:hypothetical protein
MRIILIFTSIVVAICTLWFLLKPREISNVIVIDPKDSFLGVGWSGSLYWNKVTVEKNPKNPDCKVSEAHHAQLENLYPDKKGYLRGYLFAELRKYIKLNSGIITEDTLSNPSINSGGYSINFKLNHFDIGSTIEMYGNTATLIICGNPSQK